ncbi:hypothetical protein B0I35DRAFT_105627 [Stachybotrys elegans]|uniref:Uncharacterized protein n=1 Tax=Stachybotrys elegans TaxID=80388 RepID=A0A8K0WL37_9HYPO|nr:hypothetical protein B0I35DRAFT_105627 [Stachybotrys elegans]
MIHESGTRALYIYAVSCPAVALSNDFNAVPWPGIRRAYACNTAPHDFLDNRPVREECHDKERHCLPVMRRRARPYAPGISSPLIALRPALVSLPSLASAPLSLSPGLGGSVARDTLDLRSDEPSASLVLTLVPDPSAMLGSVGKYSVLDVLLSGTTGVLGETSESGLCTGERVSMLWWEMSQADDEPSYRLKASGVDEARIMERSGNAASS